MGYTCEYSFIFIIYIILYILYIYMTLIHLCLYKHICTIDNLLIFCLVHKFTIYCLVALAICMSYWLIYKLTRSHIYIYCIYIFFSICFHLHLCIDGLICISAFWLCIVLCDIIYPQEFIVLSIVLYLIKRRVCWVRRQSFSLSRHKRTTYWWFTQRHTLTVSK